MKLEIYCRTFILLPLCTINNSASNTKNNVVNPIPTTKPGLQKSVHNPIPNGINISPTAAPTINTEAALPERSVECSACNTAHGKIVPKPKPYTAVPIQRNSCPCSPIVVVVIIDVVLVAFVTLFG